MISQILSKHSFKHGTKLKIVQHHYIKIAIHTKKLLKWHHE